MQSKKQQQASNPKPTNNVPTPTSSKQQQNGSGLHKNVSKVSGNAKPDGNVQQPGNKGKQGSNHASRSSAATPQRTAGMQMSTVHAKSNRSRSVSAAPQKSSPSSARGSELSHDVAASPEAVDRTWKKMEAKANPYYATLHDPFNVQGVRIPDSIDYPSSTFSVTKRVTLTASASGGVVALGLGWFVSPSGTSATQNCGYLVPLNVPVDAAGTSYVVGQSSYAAGASSTDIFGITGTGYTQAATAVTLEQWRTGTLTVPGLFNQVRLVSAGVAVNSTAPLTALGGVWRAAFCPPNYYRNRDAAANVMSFDEIGQLPDSVEVPVNTAKGATVKFSPMDLGSLDYCAINGKDDGSKDYEHADLGTFLVAGSGLGAQTSVVCTIVFNFEGIPASNTMGFIQVAPSLDDPLMIASALNRIEEEPNATAGTNEAQKLEHVTHPLHLEHDSDKIVHHSNLVRLVKKKGSGSKVLVTEEHEQVGLLESLFKSVIPLVEGGARALERTI